MKESSVQSTCLIATLLTLKSLLIHFFFPSNQKTLWLPQRFQLTCNVMTCHSLLSQLYLILSGLGVLGFWSVQSLGKMSCSFCINSTWTVILSFCICCHIEQTSPFLLLDKRMHRSQKEGRHSCWSHGKNKLSFSSDVRSSFSRLIFLRCSVLLSRQMAHPAIYRPHLPILYISTWMSRADGNVDFKCFELQLWKCFNVCV